MSDCCGEVIYKGLCKRGRPVEVLDCAVCGAPHLHPLSRPEELKKFYAESYFSEVKPNYAATSGTESEYQFLVDQEKIAAAMEGRIINDGDTLTVLDFGCGPSAPFLKHFRKAAGGRLRLRGVEPSQKEPERRTWDTDDECVVLFNSLERVKYKCDIIHLGFVLEHVANPVATLLEVRKHLAPGGRVIVEVPNDFNPLQLFIWRKSGGIPWWLSSPDHQFYHSAKSLSGLAGRAGYRVVKTGSTYPVELFLAHGQDFREDPAAGKLVTELRADLQRLWQHCGSLGCEIGRTVWVVAAERSEPC